MSFKGKGTSSTEDAAKAVWIGNLPEEATFKEVMELGKFVGTPTRAENIGCTCAYIVVKIEDRAPAALHVLNGDFFAYYY